MKLLEKQEKHLNKKVYNALCDMGVPDDSAQTIAAEAARYDDRFDSLEQSMLAMQKDLQTEMKDAISMSDKNMTKAMSELSEKLGKPIIELKADMFWVKTISIASFVTLLGVLPAAALSVFLM